MEDVPKSEEAFIEREDRRLLYGRDMQRHQFSDPRKPAPPDLSRPSQPLAFGHNRPARVSNQPYANDARPHANGGNEQEAGEDTFRSNRAKLRKRAQLFDEAVRDGQIDTDGFLQRVGIGQD